MSRLHANLISDHIFVPEEGQRDLACSNKKSLRCPSLEYEQMDAPHRIDIAFDLLFEEMIKSNNDIKL